MMIGNLFVMATPNKFVILNLFQDSALPSLIIPNQVRDDEKLFDHRSLRRGDS
ncbi:MAG: hypothetical protein ACK5OG_05400 [Sphingomonadaceae bacterium]|jgi:hypothetical protein